MSRKKTTIEPEYIEPAPQLSMWDNINSDFYKTKLPYPSKPNRPTEPTLRGKNPQDYRDHAAALEAYAANELTNYAADIAEYDKAMNDYRADGARLDQLFWKDAIADIFSYEFVKDFPKTVEKFSSMAYEHGHSSGYSDIYDHLLDYSDVAHAIMEDIRTKESQ